MPKKTDLVGLSYSGLSVKEKSVSTLGLERLVNLIQSLRGQNVADIPVDIKATSRHAMTISHGNLPRL